MNCKEPGVLRTADLKPWKGTEGSGLLTRYAIATNTEISLETLIANKQEKEQEVKEQPTDAQQAKEDLSDEELEGLSGGVMNEQQPIPPLQPTADLLPPG